MVKLKHKISAFMPTREAVQRGKEPRPSTSYRWARREGAKTNYRRQGDEKETN